MILNGTNIAEAASEVAGIRGDHLLESSLQTKNFTFLTFYSLHFIHFQLV